MQNTQPIQPLTPSSPTPTEPNVSLSSHSSSKSSHSSKIIIAILIIIVLALAGFLIYHFITTSHATTNQPDGSSSSSTTPADTNIYQQEQAVLSVVNQIYDKATEIFNRGNQDDMGFFSGVNPYTIYYNHDSSPVSYRPDNYIIGVPLDRAYGLSPNTSAIEYHYDLYYNEASDQEMTDLITSLGFTVTDEIYTTASAGGPSSLYQNKSTGIVCSGSAFWNIACGHQDWYNKENANFSNDLAKVYEAATGESAHYLIAKIDGIKDSLISPYQTISVMMSGFGASFYRTSPESPWVFAFRGQDGPTCDEFNTQDLKNAFAGQTCWDTSTNTDSEVQP